jgi:hypothetical protein
MQKTLTRFQFELIEAIGIYQKIIEETPAEQQNSELVANAKKEITRLTNTLDMALKKGM